MNQSLITYGSAIVPVPLRTPFAVVNCASLPMYIGPWAWRIDGSIRPNPGGAPAPPDAKTETGLLAVFESPFESWICNVTVYVPDAANACCAVRVDESAVSQVPSDVQSQRPCKVAIGSESDDVDASNVIVSFTI